MNITAILSLIRCVLSPGLSTWMFPPLFPSLPGGLPIPAGIPKRHASQQRVAGRFTKGRASLGKRREVFNVIQADNCGCDIVTVPHDILDKALELVGMDLKALSLDTVKMFAQDAEKAGFEL